MAPSIMAHTHDGNVNHLLADLTLKIVRNGLSKIGLIENGLSENRIENGPSENRFKQIYPHENVFIVAGQEGLMAR